MSDKTKLRQVLNLLWEERHGYPFDDWVADRREAGAGWRQIERDIYDTGLELSHMTLISWYPHLRDDQAVA